MSLPRAATADDATTSRRRGLWTVILVVFVDLLGFGVVIPILPFYVRDFGVSDVFIGLLAASYSVAQFAAAPYLGRLSDERGRRPVLLISLAGSALSWVVFGVAWAIPVLFLSRMLAGAMGGNIAAAQAYVADVTPPEERAGALGLVGAAFGVGFIFGPAIGGVMASGPVVAFAESVLPAAVPVTEFSLPSFAAAGFSLLAFVIAFFFLEEPDRDRTTTPRRSFVGQFRDALADASLRGLVVAFFLVSVAFSGVQVMFIPFAADFYGYDASQTALLLTYIGVLSVLNQGVLVGRLSRRFASARLAVAGGSVLAVALVLLPFSPELGGVLPAVGGPAWLSGELLALLAVLGLLSLGNGILNVSLSTLVSESATADRQGSAFGVTQGAGSLGRTVGPPAMAALYALAVYWSPFVAGAAVLLPVVWIVLAIARRGVGAVVPGEAE